MLSKRCCYSCSTWLSRLNFPLGYFAPKICTSNPSWGDEIYLQNSGCWEWGTPVPTCWLSTKDSEVPLRPARSPRGKGHCLTTSDACRAGGTSDTMLSLQSSKTLRLSYGTTGQLCLQRDSSRDLSIMSPLAYVYGMLTIPVSHPYNEHLLDVI